MWMEGINNSAGGLIKKKKLRMPSILGDKTTNSLNTQWALIQWLLSNNHTIKSCDNITMRYLAVFAFVLLFSHNSHAFLASTDQDYYRVIMLNGEDIPPIQGKEIDSLKLFAVIDGVLEPVPYQIDEYNIGGGVYFEGWDEPIDGTVGIVDKNDKLLALFGDSGPRKQSHMRADGNILAEIELQTRGGEKRYFYVVENSRLASDAQHVRHSIENSHVETDFFSLTYDKQNQLIWKDFTFADYQGASPVDGLKIGFDTGVIGTRVSYDNENFVAKTVAENVGPIRTTAQLHLTVVILGLDFIEGSIQLHFYPNALVYDVRLIMPETRRAMLVDPVLTMSLDFNELIGSKGYADKLSKPVMVDGMMSEHEKEANNLVLTPQYNGLALHGNNGFSLAVFLNWLEQRESITSLYYLDDKDFTAKMDRFPGRTPDAGFRVSKLPKDGLLGFVASIYFSDKFEQRPEKLSQKLMYAPDIKVNF